MYTESHTTILKYIDLIRSTYLELKSEAKEWHEVNLYNKGWDAITLVDKYSIVKNTDLDFLFDGTIINAGFSILRPNCMLKPHKGYEGYAEHITRNHLCLWTSEDTGISVEGVDHLFKEGELFSFDDSKLHYAWNHGTCDRVNFMYDVILPGHEIVELR